MSISSGGERAEGVTGKPTKPIMKVLEANTSAVEVVKIVEDLKYKV